MYRKEYNIKKKYRDTNTTTTMNTLQLIMTQFAAIISLATASGILLHDSHIDKAFAGAVNHAQADSGTSTSHESAKTRVGSNPHTHAEHMKVSAQRNDNLSYMPKNRDRKRQAIKRQALGFHGENVCMPLAGEWV